MRTDRIEGQWHHIRGSFVRKVQTDTSLDGVTADVQNGGTSHVLFEINWIDLDRCPALHRWKVFSLELFQMLVLLLIRIDFHLLIMR